MDRHASNRIADITLDEIEAYHRIRNQLYHSGDAITVEVARIQAYLQIAETLFQSFFGEPPAIELLGIVKTKTGEFLSLWNELQAKIRAKLPTLEPATLVEYWSRENLATIAPSLSPRYDTLSKFRNSLVYGLDSPDKDTLGLTIGLLRQLIDEVNG